MGGGARRGAGGGAGGEGGPEATPPGTASGPAPSEPSPRAIGFTAEPANLDFTTTDGAAIPEALLVNVYEGLVKIDQTTGEIVPLLAESWAVSDAGRTYDFMLREGVTFSNGEEFTADDVKFSIERVQSDDWTISLKSGMDVVESVEVVSPTHARVVLAEPSNGWLFRMTTRIGAMFDPSGVDDLANQPVGTGPYVLEEWNRGDSLVLTANEKYWGEPPAIETVTLRYFGDPSAANNALLTGDIDVIGTVQAPESLDQFAGDGELIVDLALPPQVQRAADGREHEAEVRAIGERRVHVQDLLDDPLDVVDRRGEHGPRVGEQQQPRHVGEHASDDDDALGTAAAGENGTVRAADGRCGHRRREVADELIKRGIVAQISARHAGRLLKRGRSQTPSDPLLADTGQG